MGGCRTQGGATMAVCSDNVNTMFDVDKVEREYFKYLIIANHTQQLSNDDVDRLSERLSTLFIKDENHISIHDLAYALCELGESANNLDIYQYAIDMRY